jgi:hypothetical protein
MSYVAGEAVWKLPSDEQPPRSKKLLLLSPGGVVVIGHWADWAVAWAPLPKIPQPIKDKLYERLEKE